LLRLGKALDVSWDQMAQDLEKTVHIAVVGRVSAGKSSLTNALLRRGRVDRVADVGAESGVTTELKSLSLGDHVRLVDSPGLEDVDEARARTTEDYLHRIDVGILVVNGSADSTQVEMLERLRARCDSVFVALNKTDRWDRHGPSALDKVIAQWKDALGVDTLYPTCAFGYDEDLPEDTPLDIRGVDELRGAIEILLAERGKELRLARHMGDKTVDAGRIILDALRRAAGISLLPSPPWTFLIYQTTAVGRLHALYTGEMMSRTRALGLVPGEVADAAPSALFLAAKAVLPIPFILEPAAARQRVLNTFALLSAVHLELAAAGSLADRTSLRRRFRVLRQRAVRELAGAYGSAWKQPGFWQKLILDIDRPGG